MARGHTLKQNEGKMMNTIATYTNNANQDSSVIVKDDDSFVIVGDDTPSDVQLQAMVDLYDVKGWTCYDEFGVAC